jgi:uncharacterized protein
VILIDTSAIYALASRSDPNHAVARRKFSAILTSEVSIATHNYVLVEALALLQHRLGLAAAARFERESRAFDIEWITPETHAEAARRWALGTRTVSFVDEVSFLVMQLRGIRTAFAFDGDFADAGFDLY